MKSRTTSTETREVEPFSAAHSGLLYPGEVVYADTWDPSLGQALVGDLHFRIVMLRSRRSVPLADIQDSRIAVCVPGRGSSRERGQISKELSTIRETQGLYLTRRSPESSVVRDYLERHQEDLQGRLAGEEAARYSTGRIQSPAPAGSEIREIFAGPEPSAWYEKLAGVLLSWAYPAVPVDSSLLSRPLSSADLRAVYEAIFQTNAEARGPLGEFGPSLGLSRMKEPLVFDPVESPVFQRLRHELGKRQGEASWKEINDSLVLADGLTRPLATLYLLAFVYFGQPETELRLASDHRLAFRDGRPVRGSRLTRESIPYLPWPEDGLEESVDCLLYLRQEVSWNDALQYTSFLCQGLTEIEGDPAQFSRQQDELLKALRHLSRDVEYAFDLLEKLASALGADEGDLGSGLQGLFRVCSGTDFRQVYDLARGVFEGPQQLLEVLELLRCVLTLDDPLGDIVDTRNYIDMAVAESGYNELVVDRTALLQSMTLAVFLDEAQGWPVVKGRTRDFQVRYRRAYIDFHGRYQRQVTHLATSLEASRLKLNALELLDRLDELGAPMGLALLDRYSILERRLWLCSASLSVPPEADLEGYLRDLDRALGEQNRNLSRLLVEHILNDRLDERLENFLKIVQASDLSALCNTLNDEMVQFIQRILRGQ